MAVGKTTVANYVKEHNQIVTLYKEENEGTIAEVKSRNLKKDIYEDYLEIQRIWIRHTIERIKRAQKDPFALLDYGAEEIEFYTLFYPLSIGKNWNVQEKLKYELSTLRCYYSSRILFLDASLETLKERKTCDLSRSRLFFEHSTEKLLPLKRKWFLSRNDVDYLLTEGKSIEEVGDMVCSWVRSNCTPLIEDADNI